MTTATRGRSCAGCSTIRTARAGCRGTAGWRCTRSCADPAQSRSDVRRHLRRRRLSHRRRRAHVARREIVASAWRSMPEKYPEFGQCVHKIVLHPSRPERLFLQNHWGLYRSDDEGGELAGHRDGCAVGFRVRDGDASARRRLRLYPADRVRRVPLHARGPRCASIGHETPAGRGSRCHAACRRRSATRPCCATPWRPTRWTRPGIYFGTRSGQVFGSADEGKTWKLILGGLPSVVCVKTAVMDGARAEPVTRRVARAPKRGVAPRKRRAPKRR